MRTSYIVPWSRRPVCERLLVVVDTIVGMLWDSPKAGAQGRGPRAYPPSPVGANVPVGAYTRTASAALEDHSRKVTRTRPGDGVGLFSRNADCFRSNLRRQDLLWTFELHGGYIFHPGLWLATDATYYTGGETSLNSFGKHELQANLRYGLTLSVPIVDGMSAKLAWSQSLITRASGNFQTDVLTPQYPCFDP